jgi:2-polyprenyl-3-methyl-5-hydroxy-6-metoxy-1,4-benzoquinol methylase
MMRELEVLDRRLPAWNLAGLVNRHCPICDAESSEARFKRPDGLTVLQCDNCGAYYVSPSPDSAQLSSFYSSYDQLHRREERLSLAEFRDSLRMAVPMADLRLKELASLIKIDGAAVLDVGFGRPYFLNLVRMLGGKPYGLELDPQAIEYAKFAGIDNVSLGEIETFRPDRTFDVVTLLDVVEHPLAPVSLLRNCVRLLHRGGLLVLWTPNGAHHELTGSPVTFQVDLEHMQYLTTRSIGFVASRLGLEVVHIETLGRPSLQGVSEQVTSGKAQRSFAGVARRIVSRVPGFDFLNSVRQQIVSANRDERTGTYHLFCILRKS